MKTFILCTLTLMLGVGSTYYYLTKDAGKKDFFAMEAGCWLGVAKLYRNYTTLQDSHDIADRVCANALGGYLE